MYALFGSSGTLITLDTSDQTIIQGSVNANTLYCAFENKTPASFPLATITFARSDGAISPEIIMTANNFTYNSTSYSGWKIDFYDDWILAKAGPLQMTIKLYQGSIIMAQGMVTVSVQKAVVADYSELSAEQYSNLLSEIASIKSRLDALEGN